MAQYLTPAFQRGLLQLIFELGHLPLQSRQLHPATGILVAYPRPPSHLLPRIGHIFQSGSLNTIGLHRKSLLTIHILEHTLILDYFAGATTRIFSSKINTSFEGGVFFNLSEVGGTGFEGFYSIMFREMS